MCVGVQRHVPAALPLGMRPGTHCIRGWVDLRAGLDGYGKPRPHRDSIPEPSSPWQVTIPTEQSGLRGVILYIMNGSTKYYWKTCCFYALNLENLLQFQRFNPYPTAFPYGNSMFLHFYQQQESSTTKTVHKVINKGLKTYV